MVSSHVSWMFSKGAPDNSICPPGSKVIASFPVEEDDQIMLITSTGQAIRCAVSGISKQSRTASGVKVFDTADGEKVVSVAYIAEKNTEEAMQIFEEVIQSEEASYDEYLISLAEEYRDIILNNDETFAEKNMDYVNSFVCDQVLTNSKTDGSSEIGV